MTTRDYLLPLAKLTDLGRTEERKAPPPTTQADDGGDPSKEADVEAATAPSAPAD